MNRYQSWGRYRQTPQLVKRLYWRSDDLPDAWSGTTLLPYGLGRSYGDICLNDGGVLLDVTGLDRFIHFDLGNGVLRCEAGVTLADILSLIVPAGWFLPVTPGTKFVTVGGAIANDVHGKNHHRAGSFGCHVERFELLRSDGKRILCSPTENPEWFTATIGGLGLTGLIVWAEIRLRQTESPLLAVETIRFDNLEEFLSLSLESDRDYEYTVAWVDCLSKGPALGRGIFMRGNHAERSSGPREKVYGKGRISVPIDAPDFVLNRVTIKAFNALYFLKHRKKTSRKTMAYHPFFFPLDAIGQWNRLYGKRGFFQYQCVVPASSQGETAATILRTVAGSGQGSFLSVLKMFGAVKSPGLLSFPRAGVTLALDFPNRGPETLYLMHRLDEIVGEAGGAVYPAKDARMAPETFRTYYPQWGDFRRFIDPRFSSNFWRRVTGEDPREVL